MGSFMILTRAVNAKAKSQKTRNIIKIQDLIHIVNSKNGILYLQWLWGKHEEEPS